MRPELLATTDSEPSARNDNNRDIIVHRCSPREFRTLSWKSFTRKTKQTNGVSCRNRKLQKISLNHAVPRIVSRSLRGQPFTDVTQRSSIIGFATFASNDRVPPTKSQTFRGTHHSSFLYPLQAIARAKRRCSSNPEMAEQKSRAFV